MKRILTAVLTMLAVQVTATAQVETLIGGELESGGFGALVMKSATVNGEPALLVGGRGGWIINSTFVIGGGGYGLVNNIPARVRGPYGERFVNMGYGGLELEYIPMSHRLVHLSFQTLVGAGGVDHRRMSWRHDGDEEFNGDVFFIAEPGVNATLNVATFLRISAGMSYRYVKGLNYAGMSDSDISGPSAVLMVRVGVF
jgi:hypothetical protein